jgi:hypothetical protein
MSVHMYINYGHILIAIKIHPNIAPLSALLFSRSDKEVTEIFFLS